MTNPTTDPKTYGEGARLTGFEAAEQAGSLLQRAAAATEAGDNTRAYNLLQIAVEWRELAERIADNPHLLVRPDPNRRDDDDRRR